MLRVLWWLSRAVVISISTYHCNVRCLMWFWRQVSIPIRLLQVLPHLSGASHSAHLTVQSALSVALHWQPRGLWKGPTLAIYFPVNLHNKNKESPLSIIIVLIPAWFLQCLKRKKNPQKKNYGWKPWLVWLSGLSVCRGTETLPVRFPVRHMPGLWARSPVGGVREATDRYISHTLMFLSFSFSLSSPLYRSK